MANNESEYPKNCCGCTPLYWGCNNSSPHKQNLKTINGESLIGTGDIQIPCGITGVYHECCGHGEIILRNHEDVIIGNIKIPLNGVSQETPTKITFTLEVDNTGAHFKVNDITQNLGLVTDNLPGLMSSASLKKLNELNSFDPNKFTLIRNNDGSYTLKYDSTQIGTIVIPAVPEYTPYTLPAATEETLGGVKVGSGLSITSDGVLSADDQTSGLVKESELNKKGYLTAADLVTINNESLIKTEGHSDIVITAGNGGLTKQEVEDIVKELLGEYALKSDIPTLKTINGQSLIVTEDSTNLIIKECNCSQEKPDEYTVTVMHNLGFYDYKVNDREWETGDEGDPSSFTVIKGSKVALRFNPSENNQELFYTFTEGTNWKSLEPTNNELDLGYVDANVIVYIQVQSQSTKLTVPANTQLIYKDTTYNAGETVTVTLGDEIELKAVTVEGKQFNGWDDLDTNLSKTIVVVSDTVLPHPSFIIPTPIYSGTISAENTEIGAEGGIVSPEVTNNIEKTWLGVPQDFTPTYKYKVNNGKELDSISIPANNTESPKTYTVTIIAYDGTENTGISTTMTITQAGKEVKTYTVLYGVSNIKPSSTSFTLDDAQSKVIKETDSKTTEIQITGEGKCWYMAIPTEERSVYKSFKWESEGFDCTPPESKVTEIGEYTVFPITSNSVVSSDYKVTIIRN